ncbi:hypothetical protein ASF29_22270 [Rhizobium sp. Leaf262]|nr:hypothetical protein ASF29_22270 [Rhizobium sp. Leaf262]
MSEKIAVSVRNVSKKFRLFDNHGDRLKEALHPFRKTYHRDFWALNEIGFDIRKGEIVGILGRNGSGKSTLLQMICGVMRPTRGEIETKGRISALLELGAGFNPEFTGRANVILNGAIMGFSADEMKLRMPEIEAFADVGDFFDQPVKTYSSGMFVRVAFAAAINIDPEILIVDEALSVGDAKFQHKCYNKIEGFRTAGKTILLVTHDIGQITAHCDRAILLDRSRLLMDGPPREVVDKYIEMLFADEAALQPAEYETSAQFETHISYPAPRTIDDAMSGMRLEQRGVYCKDESRYGNLDAEIVDCVVEADGKIGAVQITTGSEITLHVKVRFHKAIQPLYGFAVKSLAGIEVFATNTFMRKQVMSTVPPGEEKTIKIAFHMPLQSGDYFFDIGVAAVDGTDGGLAADVRRSVMMLRVAPKQTKSTHNGLVDLSAKFDG